MVSRDLTRWQPVKQVPLILVATACLLAGLQPLHAADDAPGAWITASVTGGLGSGDDSRWFYWTDVQGRYPDLGTGANQWLVRPAVGYELNDRTRAWVGYARFRTSAGIVVDEDRFWQQLDWKAGAHFHGNLSLRLRLEQRDIEFARDVRHVARFRAQYVRPVGKDGKRSLVISLEPFFDINSSDWGGDKGFSQSRAYAALSWRLGTSAVIETGYMYQYLNVEGGRDRANHLAMLSFKFDLRDN